MYKFEICIFVCQINHYKTSNEQQSLKGLCCLDFGDCICQGYDGAQGIVKGVAKKFTFKDNNSAAISVHCLAYCINLYLQEVTRSFKCIKVVKFKHKLGTQIPLTSTNVNLYPL